MAFSADKLWLAIRTLVGDLPEAPTGKGAWGLEDGGTGIKAAGATDADKAFDVLQTFGLLDGANQLLAARLSTILRIEQVVASDLASKILKFEHPNVPESTDAYGYARSTDVGSRRFRIGANGYTAVAEGTIVVDNGAGYGIGVATIHVAGVTVEPAVGDAFKLVPAGQKYKVTAVTTLVSGELDITFTPALTVAAVDGQRLFFQSDYLVDLDLETKGLGRIMHEGDPIPQTMKPTRRISSQPFGGGFSVVGMQSPIVRSPGAAQASSVDTDGTWTTVTYDGSAGIGTADSVCGIHVPQATQRRHDPEYIFLVKTALLESRLHLGLYTADPALVDGPDLGLPIRTIAPFELFPATVRPFWILIRRLLLLPIHGLPSRSSISDRGFGNSPSITSIPVRGGSVSCRAAGRCRRIPLACT
jgi:hypothetical protein